MKLLLDFAYNKGVYSLNCIKIKQFSKGKRYQFVLYCKQ